MLKRHYGADVTYRSNEQAESRSLTHVTVLIAGASITAIKMEIEKKFKSMNIPYVSGSIKVSRPETKWLEVE